MICRRLCIEAAIALATNCASPSVNSFDMEHSLSLKEMNDERMFSYHPTSTTTSRSMFDKLKTVISASAVAFPLDMRNSILFRDLNETEH